MQYILSLAATTNAVPLPSVPEVFGVRLPPPAECLTSVDFDLVPSKPPPGVKLYDEEIEEVEESEDEDEDMEPTAIPTPAATQQLSFSQDQYMHMQEAPSIPAPIGAVQTPEDIDMMNSTNAAQEEASEDEGGDLFSGGEEEEESGDEAMEVSASVPAGEATNGVKRKLVEEEDYD